MAGHAKAKRPIKKSAPDTIIVCRRYFSGMELLGHNILTHRQIMATTDDSPCETVETERPCDYAMGMLDPFRCDLHGHILLMFHDVTRSANEPTTEKRSDR